MASRKLSDLHPDLRVLATKFMLECNSAGLDILITCTYRSGQEQDELYAQGRTKPGKKVTNAKAGQSKHNSTLNGTPASRAFDIVPMVGGKPQWAASHPHWKLAGEIGERCGLEWAGRWTRFKEFPHFQLRD